MKLTLRKLVLAYEVAVDTALCDINSEDIQTIEVLEPTPRGVYSPCLSIQLKSGDSILCLGTLSDFLLT